MPGDNRRANVIVPAIVCAEEYGTPGACARVKGTMAAEARMFREILYDDELAALRHAFDAACNELGLTAEDTEGRERLAQVMISLAKSGETDANKVRAQAISLMQTH
jgi:hypothetical protein